jgi:hypothetical protein
MKPIYNIKQEWLELMSLAEQQEGILEDSQVQELKIVQENYLERIEEYSKIVKTLESEIKFCDSEIERISKLKLIKSNLVDRLEQFILDALITFGQKDSKKDIWRLELGTFKLSTRKSQSVQIDEELIGNEWKQVTVKDKLSLEDLAKVADVLGRNLETITVILKTNIKKAIEDGNQIEGASIVEKFGLTLK